MTDTAKKSCFVISPIDEPESDIRRRSDQVLRHIIRPPLEERGYEPIRADEIAKPGIITSQIIQHIIEDDLVIADLTDRNPNVFYELAIRHAIAKPFIQIIQAGDELPFDVHGTRTVFFNLHDPDSVSEAKSGVLEQIHALEENPSDLETPITVSLDLQRLRSSENPDQRLVADLISTITEMRGTEGQNIDGLVAKVDELTNEVRRSSTQLRSANRRAAQHAVQDKSLHFGFVVALAVFKDILPGVYEIGMEAFRLRLEGQRDKSRELNAELNKLLTSYDSFLSPTLREIVQHFPSLFHRLMSETGDVAEPDDLPF